MAIDLIEESELSALAPSRLGNKNFVDDSDFSNFSIVSKREKRRRAQESIGGVNAEYSIDPKYQNDCEYLLTRLEMLQNAIDSEMSKNPSKVTMERLINPMKDWETKYKNAIALNKCIDTIKKAQTEAEKKETIDILTKTTEPPTSFGNTEEDKSSKTTTYIIYGVGGLIGLVALFVLFKRSN
jgi:hypothetical protein